MRFRHPALVAIPFAGALLLSACGSDDGGTASGAMSFDMSALEDSGVTGTAELSQDGTTVSGTIRLSGFEPNSSHAMHLHGEAEGNFGCSEEDRTTNHLIDFPDLVADADGNVEAEIEIDGLEERFRDHDRLRLSDQIEHDDLHAGDDRIIRNVM